MFYTLDRIEDNDVAVLCDDEGRIFNVSANLLNGTPCAGDVFREENGCYVADAEETAARRSRISKKRADFFNRIKNKK